MDSELARLRRRALANLNRVEVLDEYLRTAQRSLGLGNVESQIINAYLKLIDPDFFSARGYDNEILEPVYEEHLEVRSEGHRDDCYLAQSIVPIQILNLTEVQERHRPLLKRIILPELTSQQVSVLQGFKNLEALTILELKPGDYSALGQFHKLKGLNLHADESIELQWIENCTLLQTLSLYTPEQSDFSFLKSLSELKSLDLACPGFEKLSLLNGLKRLETLKLSSLSTQDVSSLSHLPQLKNLSFFDMELEQFSQLAALSKLESLELEQCSVDDLHSIQSLTGLKRLHIDGLELESCEFISHLTEIESLLMSLSSDSIAPLSSLQNLKSLIISGESLVNISPLKELEQLHTLSLWNCRELTDLSPLTELKSLKKLAISFSNAHWEPLTKLKQLSTLYFHSVRPMNDEDLRQLKEALPDTNIMAL